MPLCLKGRQDSTPTTQEMSKMELAFISIFEMNNNYLAVNSWHRFNDVPVQVI